MMENLDTRQRKLLRAVIQNYIDHAKPVGSRYLVESCGLDCSPATVRNEMAHLERSGYVRQPHTSAGRVPTDRGYRFYLNKLIQYKTFSQKQKEAIDERIENAGGNVNLILDEASRILSSISKELGIVITPWMSWGIFDRMELIALSGCKVLAVIHVRSRSVKTMIFELESQLSQEELEKTAAILNERLSGLTLEEIQTKIKQYIKDVSGVNRKLLHYVIASASELFDFSEPIEVHTSGTQNILSQPEFESAGMLEAIFALLDNRKTLIHVFNDRVEGIEVTIGRENKEKGLRSFTVIKASYKRGKDIGTLGIIGPTRMPYRKIIPLMSCMASTVSQYLS